MDMANRAPRKCIGDGPGRSSIGRRVDVDFVAGGIIEVFSPVDGAAGNASDVQRARAASDRMRRAEFVVTGTKRDDRSRDGGDNSTGRQNRERVEAATEQARAQAIDDR